MRQVSLTIGHNVGDEPRYTTPEVAMAVHTILGVQAFTAIPCVGMWKGMAEQSTRIEIICDESEATSIAAEVPYLAQMLEQEAIMCEVRECATSFVYAPRPAMA